MCDLQSKSENEKFGLRSDESPVAGLSGEDESESSAMKFEISRHPCDASNFASNFEDQNYEVERQIVLF